MQPMMFRNLNRRNRIIATVLVITVTSLMAGLVAAKYSEHIHRQHPVPTDPFKYPPKPPAALIRSVPPAVQRQVAQQATLMALNAASIPSGGQLGPHGTTGPSCGIKFYYLIPYYQCWVLLQPATARDLDKWLSVPQNVALGAGLVQGTLTTLCLPSPWAWACGLIGLFYYLSVIYYTHIAATNWQCLRLQWQSFVPAKVSGVIVDNYGKWETWIYRLHNGIEYRYWGYPTSCRMPRDCIAANPGGNGCVV